MIIFLFNCFNSKRLQFLCVTLNVKLPVSGPEPCRVFQLTFSLFGVFQVATKHEAAAVAVLYLKCQEYLISV